MHRGAFGTDPVRFRSAPLGSTLELRDPPSRRTPCVSNDARSPRYHATLAEESSAAAAAAATGVGDRLLRTRFLNYAPGPLDTDMQAKVRGSAAMHAPLRAQFVELHATGGLVSAPASAGRCVRLVLDGGDAGGGGDGDGFAPGAHVDYYDLE